MIQFFETVMGRKFFTSDVPRLIEAINRNTEAKEEGNRLIKAFLETLKGDNDGELSEREKRVSERPCNTGK